MAKRYLDPKADLTFKKVFGEHPDLVISLLYALLPLGDDEQAPLNRIVWQVGPLLRTYLAALAFDCASTSM